MSSRSQGFIGLNSTTCKQQRASSYSVLTSGSTLTHRPLAIRQRKEGVPSGIEYHLRVLVHEFLAHSGDIKGAHLIVGDEEGAILLDGATRGFSHCPERKLIVRGRNEVIM